MRYLEMVFDLNTIIGLSFVPGLGEEVWRLFRRYTNLRN
jgi:hypothetical protein